MKKRRGRQDYALRSLGLLVILRAMADSQGRVEVSCDALAAVLGVRRRRSAYDRLQTLIQNGYLKTERPGHGRRPSVYQLTAQGRIAASSLLPNLEAA